MSGSTSVCVIVFYFSLFVFVSQSIGEVSDFFYSALKENKFQKTCIVKLELFLPILSPFPTFILELAWILLVALGS